MKRAFILLNHHLTENQKDELKHNFEVEEIKEMPSRVRNVWKAIQPELQFSSSELSGVINWLNENATRNDIVVAQGEFGATFYVVDYCFQRGLLPLYAASKRHYEEQSLSDGNVKRLHIFRHVRFKKYSKYEG